MKKSALNVPNTLSLIRVLLVPLFVASLLFMTGLGVWGMIIPAILYIITGLTDMLDGKIARKYNLITDFGKFIDPLADKFMVLASMISILVWMILRGELTCALVFVWVVLIILLRELGVTSLRLVVAGKSGIVVAASMLGKIKTVSQMVGTVVLMIEPLIWQGRVVSYIFMAVMAFTTVFSGLDYLKAYLPHIDTNK